MTTFLAFAYVASAAFFKIRNTAIYQHKRCPFTDRTFFKVTHFLIRAQLFTFSSFLSFVIGDFGC
jgi:hypothetical protein